MVICTLKIGYLVIPKKCDGHLGNIFDGGAVKETSQCDGGANILWEEEDEFAWEERAESKYLGMGGRRRD